MKIKRGDKVIVIYGKDKGREGTVERVYHKQNKVLIPKINTYKRHIKKSENAPQGGIVELSRPIDISKVMLISPKTKKISRVGYQIVAGRKVRILKRTGETI